MVDNLFSIVGIALVATIICILIKQYKPEYAMLISIVCGVIIFSMIIVSLVPAFQAMKTLMSRANINNEYIGAMVKTLGVCYVTQLASDSCNDAGQTAIASKVELCGKVFIVIISLPLFENLIDVALRLIVINA